MIISCPRCRQRMRASQSQAGRQVRCNHCQQILIVPSAANSVTEPPNSDVTSEHMAISARPLSFRWRPLNLGTAVFGMMVGAAGVLRFEVSRRALSGYIGEESILEAGARFQYVLIGLFSLLLVNSIGLFVAGKRFVRFMQTTCVGLVVALGIDLMGRIVMSAGDKTWLIANCVVGSLWLLLVFIIDLACRRVLRSESPRD